MRKLWILAGAVAISVVTAACDTRNGAACDQAEIAACAVLEHCTGTPAAECESARAAPSFGNCGLDAEAARVCVEAINDVLAQDCDVVPALPCPDALLIVDPTEPIEDLYVGCGAGDGCPAPFECVLNANTGAGLCTQSCVVGDECPAQDNDFTPACVPLLASGTFCAAGCSSDDDCSPGLICADGANCVPAP